MNPAAPADTAERLREILELHLLLLERSRALRAAFAAAARAGEWERAAAITADYRTIVASTRWLSGHRRRVWIKRRTAHLATVGAAIRSAHAAGA